MTSRLEAMDLLSWPWAPHSVLTQLRRRAAEGIQSPQREELAKVEASFDECRGIGADGLGLSVHEYDSVARLAAVWAIARATIERFEDAVNESQRRSLESEPIHIGGIEAVAEAVRNANQAPARAIELATAYRLDTAAPAP